MGETIGRARIEAKPLWNATGIRLEQGHLYRLRATGEWIDWYIRCGPEGHDAWLLRAFGGWRRAPAHRWFELIGAIDRKLDGAFAIGRDRELVAFASGELTCFANDAPGFYFNNRGFVDLEVVLLGPAPAP